ncbi:hypothetical protein H6G80_03995 [Nostoc sp. FACHB-87]|uniref:hypothetical protein n=1 Tax=Nostocaceae TaxID=1162 RepID=UPI001682C360|nr:MULTISPECIES: hypothetical protein [Nostocaceae]MBD2453236.1 hypothetical protein [Nostoc sp. FACHB-87]MBD2474984.1 hypothetical protein [Anabaena sp. FACHB-83]
MQNTKTFRWKRVILVAVIGVLAVLALNTVYVLWRKREEWCIRFHPDGKQQVLYGNDCWK